MAWNLSTGLIQALLGGNHGVAHSVNAATISAGAGDGTVITGADTINDSGAGLIGFKKHDFVLIVGGTNDAILVKALDVIAGKIEVAAGSLTAEAAGTAIALVNLEGGGSLEEIFQNSTMDVYNGVRPTNADLTEAGVKLLPFTKDGAAFAAGVATNGLNLGAFSGNVLKRAVDPETGITEVWKGQGVADGTAGYARWYANNKVIGASSSAIRMDGAISTSGADLNMVNGTSIVTGVTSEVSDVNFTLSAA
jgi:hypothetical protein